MDSQDNTLNQGNLESENPVNQVIPTENSAEEQPSETPDSDKESGPVSETTPETDTSSNTASEVTVGEDLPTASDSDNNQEEELKVFTSKKEIIDRLKVAVANDEQPSKRELDHLKTTFYKIHKAEREANQKEYLDNGGDPATYQVFPDEDEEVFKAEMSVLKEKRAKLFLQSEEEKQNNLNKKLEIIEKIKAMATSPDEANKSFQDFKNLQQQWKEIKSVPADKANELWRNYQLYVEQFYDLLNLNREAREYDFKKNLELKTKICEAAEKLSEEKDIISAFHQLQELHQQYREIGPVAKEVREEIWNRFKTASSVINKSHQLHFEKLREEEEANLTKKTALCEQAEAILKQENKGPGDWDNHTKEIIALQAEWKATGFAPLKMNVRIFERFRSACDTFFSNKSEYFKQMKESFAENAEKKKALVEKAQALSESTDWKATSETLIELQKEWKTIGMVPKKLGDQLWKDFINACNKFFEARNKTNAGARNEEHANLNKKKEIIEKLNKLSEEPEEDIQEKVQALVEEYNKVGHVPFKEKDKIFKEYHAVLDNLYNNLHISVSQRRLDKFKNNLRNVSKRGEESIDNERSRLMYRYEQLKSEIITYENNLGFLNSSSKKGNSLIDEMNRKVQKLKDDCKLIHDKIKAIDTQNKNEE